VGETPSGHPGVTKPSKPRVLVDATKWSAKSKQSAIVEFPPKEYEDIAYACWRCKKPSIYTAEDQRHAFEVRKAYIWQRRVLCAACWRERLRIERAIGKARASWKANRKVLKNDRRFLRNWLALLERARTYGSRPDTAGIAMLARLLAFGAR